METWFSKRFFMAEYLQIFAGIIKQRLNSRDYEEKIYLSGDHFDGSSNTTYDRALCLINTNLPVGHSLCIELNEYEKENGEGPKS